MTMAMYLVVFRNRKRADIDGPAYDADAARMHDLAQRQPGFLAFKSYAADDGEVVAISEWVDEARRVPGAVSQTMPRCRTRAAGFIMKAIACLPVRPTGCTISGRATNPTPNGDRPC